MSASDGGFRDALTTDVRNIHRDGLPLGVEPRRYPALAELATAVVSKPMCSRDAIRTVMGWAIDRASGPLLLVFPNAKDRLDIKEALAGLLDLSATPLGTKSRTIRGNAAGPKLGYPTGYEGFRHGEHEKTSVVALVFKGLVDELVTIGNENKFTYTRLYASGHSPPPENVGAEKPIVIAATQPLHDAILRDLQELYRSGYDTSGPVPTINAIAARHTYNGVKQDWYEYGVICGFRPSLGAILSHYMDFLLWAIHSLENPKVAEGLLLLLGLDESTRHSSLFTRQHRSANCFGMKSGASLAHSDLLPPILEQLCNTIAGAAIQTDFELTTT